MTGRIAGLGACVAVLVLPAVLFAADEVGNDEKAAMKKTETKAETKAEKKVEKEDTKPLQIGVDDRAPTKSSIEEKLESRRISCYFDQTPVAKALDHLADLTDTNFIIDIPEEKNVKVTLRVNKMTMENALHWLCTLAKIKYYVVEDAVYFGTKPVQRKILKMYNLKDLLHPAADYPGPQMKIQTDDDEGGFEIPDANAQEDNKLDPEVIVNTIKEITKEPAEEE